MLKKRNLSAHVYNENEADELVSLIRDSFIATFTILEETLNAGSFGDLGTFGPVFPVAEPDIREVMKAKMAGIDWKKKEENAWKNFFRKRSEYGHDTLLDYAMYRRARLIDPSVTLETDITDKYGKVLIPAGPRANPLDAAPFDGIMAVFDPGRESEIEEIRKWLAAAGTDTSDPRVTFLATRIPSSETEDGWEFYTKLTHDLRNHVFLLGDDVRKAFSLRVTPSVVTGDPERKLLRVSDLGKIPAPAGVPEIEPRGFSGSGGPYCRERRKKRTPPRLQRAGTHGKRSLLGLHFSHVCGRHREISGKHGKKSSFGGSANDAISGCYCYYCSGSGSGQISTGAASGETSSNILSGKAWHNAGVPDGAVKKTLFLPGGSSEKARNFRIHVGTGPAPGISLPGGVLPGSGRVIHGKRL